MTDMADMGDMAGAAGAAPMGAPLTTIVVPTVGRPSLTTLMAALAAASRRPDAPVILVDDRPADDRPADDRPAGPGEPLPVLAALPHVVLRSRGRGPAAARNLGWRFARTPWVSFLDDDVVPDEDWYAALLADLAGAPDWVVGSQGRLRVPLPEGRRPTDWERSTHGLEQARWITADMSCRRGALSSVGGFDERFPRAYREDADLALRLVAAHGRIVPGSRRVTHPVRPADAWASLRQQAGNADDMLMNRLHGTDWRHRAAAPPGRRPRHVATVSAAAVGAGAAALGRKAPAALGLLAWAALTAELALGRILPGPRDRAEVVRMAATSVAIPFAAVGHAARGAWAHRHAEPWRGIPDVVLFDRDGTLVHDVPYNGDPGRVQVVEGVREALDGLRASGVRLGIVTNQSGVASGRITREQVESVNAKVEQLLGPFDAVTYCPHAASDMCLCRKPAPGMVKQVCAELDVSPSRVVVVGDIGADVQAAQRCGAAAVLVPTAATRPAEVRAAGHVCPDVASAVDDILAGRW